ncbi:unnamed protein product [Camellia sinensis]
MAGGDGTVAGDPTQAPLRLVRDVLRLSAAGFGGAFKRDCTDLARRVSLLAHLLEEIRDFKTDLRPLDVPAASSSSNSSFLSDLIMAIQAAKRLISSASNFDSKIYSDLASKQISFQFQCVTWNKR